MEAVRKSSTDELPSTAVGHSFPPPENIQGLPTVNAN